ncbi:MAG: GumC family protein [Methylocystis sp.]|uniref:GumC family protein n=1 Tax=Methylocystis sp. TaxID=1911079 RepID=UPI003DA1E227
MTRSSEHATGRGRVGDTADDVLDLWRAPARQGQALIDTAAVWLFLRRNLLRLCAVSAVSAVLAFGFALAFLTKYSATAVLIVDPRAAKVTRAGGVISNIGGDAVAIESLVQIARSEGFLGELVDELDLTKDVGFGGYGDDPEKARLSAIDRLAAKLSISRRGTTYVIDITASAPTAEASARIANAAANKILKDQTALRSGVSAATAREIESRLSELRGRVSRAEEAAAELKARLKVTDAGQGSTLLERRIFEMNQQLVLASARTAEARAHFELLRKAGATAGDSLPQSVQSSVLGALRAEYARLSRQSADQATVLGPRHPAVTSLNAQLADVKRQIAAEIGRMMSAARTEFLEAEQREADLSRQLKTAQTESGELGPQMVKLDELEREAKAERAVYEELLNRERELLQVKDLEPSDIRFASRATPPARPSPGRAILAVGALFVGLLVGFCYVFAREWRRRTIRTTAQAARLGDVEPLAFLPLLAPKVGKTSEAVKVPDLTPWLRELCRDLVPRRGGDKGRLILVASAKRGEGRSTVAVNLAASLAKGGQRTLLIEADRAAHVKKPPYGLLDVLSAGEGLRAAFVEQRADGYTLLPYGGRRVKTPDAIGALMNSVTLRAALSLARRWFDVIVIDGPPALDSPHARFLASLADEILFVVEWDKTSDVDAALALERLEATQAGLLFNKTDAARLKLYDPEQSRQLESVRLAA